MSTQSNKTLSLIEAGIISAIMVKISASKHELGSQIEYASFEYNKDKDQISVDTDRSFNPEPAKSSITKANLMSWWLSRINMFERNHKVVFKTLNATYDASQKTLETVVNFNVSE